MGTNPSLREEVLFNMTAAKDILRQTGKLSAMVIAVRHGQRQVILMPAFGLSGDKKAEAAKVIAAIHAGGKPERFILVMDAWVKRLPITTDLEDMKRASDYPDRQEAVTVIGKEPGTGLSAACIYERLPDGQMEFAEVEISEAFHDSMWEGVV